ncbi:hypothetical protein D3C71_648460 [compost metagenome]
MRLSARQKTFEHLDEVGAIQRLLDRQHTQGEAPQAVDVHAAGEQLGQRGNAFLSLGCAGRSQTEAFEVGLQRTVLCGGDMHESFVLQQLILVQFREQRTGPQADTTRPGDGFGGKGRIEYHRDPTRAEEPVQFRTYPVGKSLGRDISLGRRNPRTTQQGVGGLEEEMRRVQHA